MAKTFAVVMESIHEVIYEVEAENAEEAANIARAGVGVNGYSGAEVSGPTVVHVDELRSEENK